MNDQLPQPEQDLVASGVDIRDWGPTEADEGQVLAGLGYELDADGIYQGQGHLGGAA